MINLSQLPPKVSGRKRSLNIVGAGARGIYTAGMLKAFHEITGGDFDEMYCCSSGSLSGALYAQGDLDLLEHVWLTIRNRDVRIFNPLKIFGKEACLYDNTPLEKTLRKYIDIEKIRLRRKPVYVSMTSLRNSGNVRFRLDVPRTDIDPIYPLIASASPPILADPIKIQGTTYYDGGCSDLYGVHAAALSGATEIVILHPNRPSEWTIRNILDAHDFMMSVPMFNIYQTEKEALDLLPPDRRPRLIEVMPEQRMPGTLYDFDFKGLDRKALIKAGYDLAYRFLASAI